MEVKLIRQNKTLFPQAAVVSILLYRMHPSYTNIEYYRTLHSYNLIWAVCHLFPQQRWRTHTNIQSRETISQETHVTCLNYVRVNFVLRFLEPIPRHVFSINTSSSNTLSLFPNFHCSADTLSPEWRSYSQTEVKGKKKKKKWISLADIHFFKTLWLWDFF